VDEVLSLIGLAGKASQRARGLTADDKQKISLGRGLVRSDVNAILFDEPLTVIDPHMKWQLRSQLKHLHRRYAFTMIYVTHDQTEALTFADQVVVMYEGEVVQAGTPDELFRKPKHTFVGYFIGSPGMNVIPCTVDGARAMVGGHAVPLPAGIHPPKAARTELGVRPEFVRLTRDRDGIPVTIRKVEDIGRYKVVRADLSGAALNAIVPEGEPVPESPRLKFAPEGVNLYADSRLVEAEG
jgi:glycerol transport system ATP-binding protein